MDASDFLNLLFTACLFAALLGAYACGLWLRPLLPNHHRGEETTAVVHAVIGMLVTFAAIVLGLMVTSGKESFDTLSHTINDEAIQFVQFNRLLAEYGPEGTEAQTLLLDFTSHAVKDFSDPAPKAAAQTKRLAHLEILVRGWTPPTMEKRRLQFEMEQRFAPLIRVHWELISQSSASLSLPFYITLVLWMLGSFFVYGLNADFNLFVLIALSVAAVAICAALFVVLEMVTPLGGIVSVSDAPLQSALIQISGTAGASKN